jgi:hypothetical protein
MNSTPLREQTMFIKPQGAPVPVFAAQVPKGDPTLSYCVAAPPLATGYVDHHVECKGEVNPSLRPWAVMPNDGRVVYLDPSKLGVLSRHKNWVPYTQAVNLERRKLAETALAAIILHNPHLVGSVLNKVSAGITKYWTDRRRQLGYETERKFVPEGRGVVPLAKTTVEKYPVAWNALQATESYTHGATSFGRMSTDETRYRLGTDFPKLELLVRQNLAALHGNSIPRTLNAHDNFLRVFGHLGPADIAAANDPRYTKWLADRRPKEQGKMNEATELRQFWSANSASWNELERLERELRPSRIFNEKTPSVRGRLPAGNPDKPDKNKNVNETGVPGLLPIAPVPYLDNAWKRLQAEWFSGLAVLKDENKNVVPDKDGKKQILPTGKPIVLPIEKEARIRGIDLWLPDPTSAFMKEVNAHNLIFAAGQSGSTSTLFQAAILFGKLTGLEERKKYLMAVVAYLVGGGMHSCHELFKTAELVGIEYRVGEYDGAIPDNIRTHPLYRKWKHEFADVVGPARFR